MTDREAHFLKRTLTHILRVKRNVLALVESDFQVDVVALMAFIDVVLEHQADRLPRDVQIALWSYLVDDPTGRHPTPWSNGVYPKIKIHDGILT